jgi:hypothetical protein
LATIAPITTVGPIIAVVHVLTPNVFPEETGLVVEGFDALIKILGGGGAGHGTFLKTAIAYSVNHSSLSGGSRAQLSIIRKTAGHNH